MTAAPFMQMYWADYFADTGHLTCEQHGAYIQLLGRMWRGGGTLPNDPAKLARMTGCTASRWAKISGDVLAFFTVNGDQITHKRLGIELEKAREKSIKRAEAGSRGGEAKALKTKSAPVANASVLLCHSIEPEPERKKENPHKPPSGAKPVSDETFAQAWRSCTDLMRKRSSQTKAHAAWTKAASLIAPESLLAALKRYRAEDSDVQRTGGPGFHVWLTDRRWESWLPQPAPVATEPLPPWVISDRLLHYADTGEWKPFWGPKPEEQAA